MWIQETFLNMLKIAQKHIYKVVEMTIVHFEISQNEWCAATTNWP